MQTGAVLCDLLCTQLAFARHGIPGVVNTLDALIQKLLIDLAYNSIIA